MSISTAPQATISSFLRTAADSNDHLVSLCLSRIQLQCMNQHNLLKIYILLYDFPASTSQCI